MNTLTTFANRLWNDEDGQGMVEYGLILALIAVVVMFALYTLGNNIKGKYEDVNDQITNPASGSSP